MKCAMPIPSRTVGGEEMVRSSPLQNDAALRSHAEPTVTLDNRIVRDKLNLRHKKLIHSLTVRRQFWWTEGDGG